MKKIEFEKLYIPFLITGLFSLAFALFFKIFYPDSIFDVSIYNTDYSVANSRIWFWFSVYLLFLAVVYFAISKAKLKTKFWLVISHYIFIALFLFFFIVFSAFENREFQKIVSKVPLITLISVYSIIFITDAILFFLGVLFLFINILSLRRDKEAV